MKKIHILIACALMFLTSACTWPQYHSYRQDVEIVPPTATGGGTMYVGDDKIPFDIYPKEIRVTRTMFDKPVVYKKTGFKDYHTNLNSVITGDKWAKREGNDASGFWLLLPTNTAYYLWDSWFKIPFGLVMDVGNIVIGIPSVFLINPWYEYDPLYLAEAILEPTEEFKAQCAGDGHFISNDRCTDCDAYDAPISSAEECARCPNRRYEDSRCYYE